MVWNRSRGDVFYWILFEKIVYKVGIVLILFVSFKNTVCCSNTMWPQPCTELMPL